MAMINAIVNHSGVPKITSVPYPTLPKDDYLIVKPTAWAINPVDYQHLDLEDEESCDGCHVGFDYAGVVVEVGPGVTKRFKKGDRISGVVNGQNILQKTDGAFAEFFATKGDAQFKTPNGLADTDAATQGVAVATMGQALYRDLKLPWPSGSNKEAFNIFIYGGSTAMGIAGIQFSKLSGGVVIATSSPPNAKYLKSLGADYVVDYKSPSLVDDIRSLEIGPILYALDCRPSEDSATVCANLLSRQSGSKYVALDTRVDRVVKSLNSEVKTYITLAYSAVGEPWFFERTFHDSSVEDFELQRTIVSMAEGLLARGKLHAPRIFLNRGGNGFQGVLKGLEELRNNKVSGGKLVYTVD